MELSDEAIILATRAYGESSAIVDVFCAEYGVYAGMVKGANSKSKRGVFQAGNIVHATWRARLSEQLGTLICELETPIAALILSDRLSLTVLNTATELIKRLIPERHPEPMLYARLKTLLMDMRDQDNPNMLLRDYIRFELELLRDLGFGLDLTRCAGSGTTENLIYVSPKSACAVSAEAGEPYKDKLPH
jgi:DNA repair protein RecO (recombination protein O)